MSDGTTTGVWIPGDSDLLARYDAVFGGGQRSAAIRDAMDLQLVVDDVLSDAGYGDLERGRDRRAFVRQALLEKIRREQSG